MNIVALGIVNEAKEKGNSSHEHDSGSMSKRGNPTNYCCNDVGSNPRHSLHGKLDQMTRCVLGQSEGSFGTLNGGGSKASDALGSTRGVQCEKARQKLGPGGDTCSLMQM